MEFRGPPRMRGSQHRMPNRGGQFPPQQNQQRMMNPNIPTTWVNNNINSYPCQEETYQYQQPPMNMEGYQQAFYAQNQPQTAPGGYPHSIQSTELLNPNAQGFPGYAPPTVHFIPPPIYGGPMDPVYMNAMPSPPMIPSTPPPTVNAGPPKKLTAFNSRDSLLTCANCKHKNTLLGIELNKKDDENKELRDRNEALTTQVLVLEAELQALRESKPVSVDGGHHPVGSLLSPNAVAFEPKKEVPVVSIKGMNDEVSETQADCVEEQTEVAGELQIEVPEEPLEIEPASSASNRAKHEALVSAATPAVNEVSEECWDDETSSTAEPISAVPVETKPLAQPEPDHAQLPVVADDGWNETEMPQSSEHLPQGGLDASCKTADAWSQVKPGRGGMKKSRGSEYGPGNNYNYNRSYHNARKGDEHNDRPQNAAFNQNERGPGHQFPRNQNYKHNNQRFSDENAQSGPRDSIKEGSTDQRDFRNGAGRDGPKENKETSGRRWEIQRDDGGHMSGPDRSHGGSSSYSGPYSRNRGNQDCNRYRENRRTDRDHINTGAGGSNNRQPCVKQIVKEVSADLFTAPKDVSLGHCVARDFRMGSGIAVKFKTEFKRVHELLDQNVDVGGCAFLEDKDNGRYIFYLVTKAVSSGKPIYPNLHKSLEDLKAKCQKFGVEKLAIPHIGCGLDGLYWPRVREMINEVFQDTNMEITAYDFNQEGLPEAEGNKSGPSGPMVKHNVMNLVDIDPQTALVFLGTEDAHMDKTCNSLNSKFKFANEYKNASKNTGDVWCFKAGNYYIYSFIVKKSFTDQFLFSNLKECCVEFAKLLKKHEFNYVGVEYFEEWSGDDSTFTEKIATLLRNTLPRIIREFWVCYPDEKLDVHDMCKKKGAKKPQF